MKRIKEKKVVSNTIFQLAADIPAYLSPILYWAYNIFIYANVRGIGHPIKKKDEKMEENNIEDNNKNKQIIVLGCLIAASGAALTNILGFTGWLIGVIGVIIAFYGYGTVKKH